MEYKDLYAKDGDFYFIKICEELGELQTAILHHWQQKVSNESVVEEIADVQIQLEKIIEYICGFDRINIWHTEKRIAEIKHDKKLELANYLKGKK